MILVKQHLKKMYIHRYKVGHAGIYPIKMKGITKFLLHSVHIWWISSVLWIVIYYTTAAFSAVQIP